MIIRSMTENDIAEVCKIEEATFSIPWNGHDFSKSIKNDNDIYLVAEEDGRVIAYCGLWGIVGEGHITNVAVDKECQDRGIAFKMLSELIERGKEKGIGAFTLEVRTSNEKAIYLYEKLGFKKVGLRQNFYDGPREDGLVMWLY